MGGLTVFHLYPERLTHKCPVVSGQEPLHVNGNVPAVCLQPAEGVVVMDGSFQHIGLRLTGHIGQGKAHKRGMAFRKGFQGSAGTRKARGNGKVRLIE